MLPFVLIWLLMAIKHFELFPVPGWLMGGALILGAVTFFLNGILNREKKNPS